MSSADFMSISNEKYINLMTFRRNGQSVQTPVWFIEVDGRLYVRTQATSWKVKRIQANPDIRVAPCRANGTLKGDWYKGRAVILAPDEHPFYLSLLNKKYGLQSRLIQWGMAFRRDHQVALLKIEPLV